MKKIIVYSQLLLVVFMTQYMHGGDFGSPGSNYVHRETTVAEGDVIPQFSNTVFDKVPPFIPTIQQAVSLYENGIVDFRHMRRWILKLKETGTTAKERLQIHDLDVKFFLKEPIPATGKLPLFIPTMDQVWDLLDHEIINVRDMRDWISQMHPQTLRQKNLVNEEKNLVNAHHRKYVPVHDTVAAAREKARATDITAKRLTNEALLLKEEADDVARPKAHMSGDEYYLRRAHKKDVRAHKNSNYAQSAKEKAEVARAKVRTAIGKDIENKNKKRQVRLNKNEDRRAIRTSKQAAKPVSKEQLAREEFEERSA